MPTSGRLAALAAFQNFCHPEQVEVLRTAAASALSKEL